MNCLFLSSFVDYIQVRRPNTIHSAWFQIAFNYPILVYSVWYIGIRALFRNWVIIFIQCIADRGIVGKFSARNICMGSRHVDTLAIWIHSRWTEALKSYNQIDFTRNLPTTTKNIVNSQQIQVVIAYFVYSSFVSVGLNSIDKNMTSFALYIPNGSRNRLD